MLEKKTEGWSWGILFWLGGMLLISFINCGGIETAENALTADDQNISTQSKTDELRTLEDQGQNIVCGQTKNGEFRGAGKDATYKFSVQLAEKIKILFTGDYSKKRGAVIKIYDGQSGQMLDSKYDAENNKTTYAFMSISSGIFYARVSAIEKFVGGTFFITLKCGDVGSGAQLEGTVKQQEGTVNQTSEEGFKYFD